MKSSLTGRGKGTFSSQEKFDGPRSETRPIHTLVRKKVPPIEELNPDPRERDRTATSSSKKKELSTREG